MPTRDAILEVWRQLIKHYGKENTPAHILDPDTFGDEAEKWVETLGRMTDVSLRHAAGRWMRNALTFPTWLELRLLDAARMDSWVDLKDRQLAIDLLDQACQEGAFCDTHPKCGVGCVACTRTILARANQLAQEITDGSRTQSQADEADGQDVQRRPDR